MRVGTRTKLIGLMTGLLMVLGAGSAFAATNTATTAGTAHPGTKAPRHTMHRRHTGFLVIGRIVKTDGDTFTLATRAGELKVHIDDNTKYRNGSRSDLDKGKVVAVAGKKKDHNQIDATLVAFIKHVRHTGGHMKR
jgi:hypothetical protein